MPPGLNNPRERLIENCHPGVRLVILQKDVILRLVLLDEIVFEQEGVLLTIDDNVVDVANLADQDQRLLRLLTLKKIGRHATLKVLGLSNVDYFPCLVEVLIHTGQVGQDAHHLLKMVQPLGIGGEFVIYFLDLLNGVGHTLLT